MAGPAKRISTQSKPAKKAPDMSESGLTAFQTGQKMADSTGHAGQSSPTGGVRGLFMRSLARVDAK